MLLVADLGNSSLKLGLFLGDSLKKRVNIENPSAGLLAAELRRFTGKTIVDGAVLCSVVPGFSPRLEEEIKRTTGVSPLVVSHRLKLGLKVRPRPASAVCADRLANASAAAAFHKLPCVVVDLGTANTYDVISAKGEYLGGVIAPGLKSSAEILEKKGAQLPPVKLGKPGKVIGKNTRQAMLSGIVYGQLGQLSAVLARIREELGTRPGVIATGGFSPMMAKAGAPFTLVDADLTFKGLKRIYELNS